MSYGKVCILAPPKREPDAPATAKVELTAVLARELNPPSGVEPVEWMLLTNDRIKLIADAWLRVEWYRHRWVIEVFHKALKSGQQIEERLYEHRRHRGVALAICMLAAAHIVWLSLQARLTPGLPASKVLSADEVLALATLEGTPVKKLTLGKALERIGRLGGHHARTNDGPLGWMRLWRGYAELAARIVGARQLGAAFVRADAPLG